MPRKSDHLTPRQRQSQQIMRQKAAQKKRQLVLHRAAIIGGAVACLLLLGGGAWAWKTKAVPRCLDAIDDAAYGVTLKAGFSVQALYLEGRSRTPMAEVEQALALKKGDAILKLSIDEIRARLEKIESVKFAAVERALPGTLYVRIVEREPVALWQHQGKLSPVDDNGVVMNGLDVAPYAHLPLIVGDDAPKHVDELLSMLARQPELAKRFASAIRVGERRWNIRISGPADGDGDIEVRLPETDPAEAWKKLAEMEASRQVLDRDVKVIDLRLEDRMFLKLAPAVTSGKSGAARDT